MTKQKSLAENRAEVIKYLTWFQNYPKTVSPYYITIYNFDEWKKTFSLMLYDNKHDVATKGDGLINDGLWRLVRQLPSCITAHRIYDLIDANGKTINKVAEIINRLQNAEFELLDINIKDFMYE